MLKRIKTGCILFFILTMMLSLSVSAQDIGKIPERLGSITIQLEDTKYHNPKENVVFHVTKVANIVGGKYVMEEAYKDLGIDLNLLKTANDMEEACKVLEPLAKKDLEVVTDENGVAVIKELPVGVYFIHAVDIAKYEKLTSFLVSLPTWNESDKVMEFDVEAIPKHSEIIGTIITDVPTDFWEGVATGDLSNVTMWFDLSAASLLMVFLLLLGYHKKSKMKNGQ